MTRIKVLKSTFAYSTLLAAMLNMEMNDQSQDGDVKNDKLKIKKVKVKVKMKRSQEI